MVEMGRVLTCLEGRGTHAMKQLSARESAILAELQRDPLVEAPTIAEHTGLSLSAVRHVLATLRKNGVIHHAIPFLDLAPLGYTEFAMYVSLAADSASDLDLSAVPSEALEGVLIISRLTGSYNVYICIYARDAHEAKEIFHRVTVALRWRVVSKTILIHTSFNYFGVRYFGKTDLSRAPRSILARGCTVDVDELDRQILSLMSSDEILSRRELARRLTAPHSTIENRIHRLERLGVIRGYSYLMNPTRFGYQMYRAVIRVEQADDAVRKRLAQLAALEKQIVFTAECLGDWDFEVGVHLPMGQSIGAFEDLLSAKLHGMIRSIDHVSTLKYLRVVTYPFVAALPQQRSTRKRAHGESH